MNSKCSAFSGKNLFLLSLMSIPHAEKVHSDGTEVAVEQKKYPTISHSEGNT